MSPTTIPFYNLFFSHFPYVTSHSVQFEVRSLKLNWVLRGWESYYTYFSGNDTFSHLYSEVRS
ncbi:MAG: group II intron maturase-specific domain-containing protein [bacterium]